MELDELAMQITMLAVRHSHTASWLRDLAEFDDRSTWPTDKESSCAEWLVRTCGFNLNTARERVRVAHALEKLPVIAAAMERGDVGFAKVRILSRIATPVTEERWLALALKGTEEDVQQAVRDQRRARRKRRLIPPCVPLSGSGTSIARHASDKTR